MKRRQNKKIVLLLTVFLFLTGCTKAPVEEETIPETAAMQTEVPTEHEMEPEIQTETESETPEETQTETESQTESQTETETDAQEAFHGLRVTIDAGHSGVVASGTDPVGPGASEQKAKDSGGTTGVASGVPEYVLNLDLSFKLRDELVERGYEVFMTRESNDIPIGNVERASVANDSESDIFIRMHANGSEDPSVSGGMTICPTADNPYIGYMYEECKYLSDVILENMMVSAAIENGTVWETDSMTGSNWSQAPVTIIEVGYMSNAKEDMQLQDEAYQNLLIDGIANGIDAYFGR